MRKLLLSLFLLTFCLTDMSAQWQVGIYGGADWCSRSIRNGYDYARTRSIIPGGVAGLTGQYNFLDWLGIRMDINMQRRNYNDTYSVLEDKYRYRNTYLDIPLMASFSFGGKKLRGYANIGGYAGFWMSKDVKYQVNAYITYISGTDTNTEYVMSGFSEADRKFDAGLAGGLGVSYNFFSNLEAFAESMIYYGLTNNHNTGSSRFEQPSYDTTPCLCAGLRWTFKKRN